MQEGAARVWQEYAMDFYVSQGILSSIFQSGWSWTANNHSNWKPMRFWSYGLLFKGNLSRTYDGDHPPACCPQCLTCLYCAIPKYLLTYLPTKGRNILQSFGKCSFPWESRTWRQTHTTFDEEAKWETKPNDFEKWLSFASFFIQATISANFSDTGSHWNTSLSHWETD